MKTIWIAQRVINGNWEGQSYYCFSSYKKLIEWLGNPVYDHPAMNTEKKHKNHGWFMCTTAPIEPQDSILSWRCERRELNPGL